MNNRSERQISALPVVSVFLNQPVFFDGTHYTALFPQPADLFLGMAGRVREMRICVPLLHTTEERGAAMLEVPEGARFVRLPFYRTESDLIRKLPLFAAGAWRVARREARIADVIGYVPSIAGLFFARAAGHKPRFELIRGIDSEILRRIYGRSPAGWLYGGGNRFIEWRLQQIRRQHRPVTFVYGKSLLREFEGGDSRAVVEISDGLPAWLTSGPPPHERTPATGRGTRILYAGRLSREKGIDVLLRAIAILPPDTRENVNVVVAGAGPADSELRSLSATLGLEEQVRFAGIVSPGPDLLAEYDRADLFVLPSRIEGVPRALLEATARLLPVVATSVGGVPHLLRDGESGLIVPPDDPEAMADAIGRVIGDPTLARSLGNAGRKIASANSLEAQQDIVIGSLSDAYPEAFGADARG
ncbi:MAG: glycosyltransferase family 4 protein [Chloroflexi bacterium]|nr:glycosyltransferase family 4 protein [Chloroflexota bacterium]